MSVRNRQFQVAALMLLIIIIVTIGTHQRWWDLRFALGPLSFTHWLAIIGAGQIAIFLPIYSYVKRHTKRLPKTFLTMHVFGNLLAFLLVSIHFAQQSGRPPEFAADHRTGLILYTILAISVATGFLRRFGIIRSLMRTWVFVHVSMILSFYIVLIVHILQYFAIL